MTLAKATNQRERDKFEENSEGNAAIRSILDPEQIETITPPAAITGFATSVKQLEDGHNVKITDGTTPLYIWSNGGITSARAVHWRIRESKEWLGGYCWSGVEDAASVYLHIKVGAKSAHGVGSMSSDGKSQVFLYESPTTTDDGTGLSEFCMNRETVVAPTVTLFRDPTVSADGTELECGVTGQAGKFTAGGGTISGAYWLLKPNTNYLIKVTNDSGGVAGIAIHYEWHEHVAV